jgi:HD-GYP domain-containing protein (c-di-GMP phosphodiesterase class II)/putative methionine-R-sulfoxide reductase with GAF domain/DNA-binding NarL/FixJ family response regulator
METRAQPLRVLCLCGSRGLRHPVLTVLQKRGNSFDLVKAERLSDFQEQAARGGFEVGLVDFCVLPGRAAERLQILGKLDSLAPLVLLVSESEEEQALKALDAGVIRDYIVKSAVQAQRLPFALRSAALWSGCLTMQCHILLEAKQAAILQDAIYRIAQAADIAPTLDGLFPRIHAIISEVMPAGNFYIALSSPNKGYLTFPYFVDEVDNAPLGEQAENGLTEFVLDTGQALICSEAMQMEMVERGQVDTVGALSQVWLGVPLVVDGAAIGVMVVQHYQDPNAYGEREKRVLEFVSSQVALVIKKKQASRSLQDKVAALQALAAIDRDILAARAAGEILELVCRSAGSLLKTPMAAIVSTQGGDWKLEATFGIELPDLLLAELHEVLGNGVGTGMAGFSVQDMPPALPDKPGFFMAQGIRSILAENLSAEAIHRGILLIFDVCPRAWSADDAGLLRALAGQAAIALDKARLLSEAERRGDEFAALHDVSAGLSGERDLHLILSLIAESVIQLLEVPSVFIYLYDEKHELLNLSVEIGRGFPAGLTVKLGEGMAGQVAATRKPLLVRDYHTWNERLGKLDEISYSAVLEVPMLMSGILIGVLGVAEAENKTRVFTEEDTRLLSLFAGQAASAVYNARLFEAIQKSNQELDRLYRASDALIGAVTANIADLSQKIAQIVISEFQHTNCSLWLLPKDSDCLQRGAIVGTFSSEFVERSLLVAGPGLIPKAVRTGQFVNSSDVLVDPDYLAGWSLARSELVLPLKSGGRVIGALDVQSTEPFAFHDDDVRTMSQFASRASLMLEHARLVSETAQHLHRLSALHTVDLAVASSLDLQVTLKVFLEQVITQLHVDAADVLLINPHFHLLEYAAGRGFRGTEIGRASLMVGEDAAGRSALERKVVGVSELGSSSEPLSHPERIAGEGFVSVYAAPLIARGQVKGVLELYFRKQFRADTEWENFVETLARQAAVAIDDAHLFEQLQRSYAELAVAYDNTIEGWARLLELRNIEPQGHNHYVSALVVDIARRMGVPEQELAHFYRGALLHDIGKLVIPDVILLKPGKLTEDEMMVVRTHPVFAHDFLWSIEYLRPAIHIPYAHHEKWDGSGYPCGLKGEQIPLAARIFSVVDVWDILKREQPYRPAWSESDAASFIREHSGNDFDPLVVETFLDFLKEEQDQAASALTDTL